MNKFHETKVTEGKYSNDPRYLETVNDFVRKNTGNGCQARILSLDKNTTAI